MVISLKHAAASSTKLLQLAETIVLPREGSHF